MRHPVLSSFHRRLLAAAFGLLLGQTADAQPAVSPVAPVTPSTIPLSATVSNGNVTISWHVVPGKWELAEQQPPVAGDWKGVPTDKYQTNGATVSVTLPLPKETTFYQLKRSFILHPPAFPPFPSVPAAPTNRPPPNLPGRP